MKLRILFAAHRRFVSGEVYDLPDAEALALIDAGDAEAVDKKTPALDDPRAASGPAV